MVLLTPRYSTVQRFVADHGIAADVACVPDNPELTFDPAPNARHWSCVLQRGCATLSTYITTTPEQGLVPGAALVLTTLAKEGRLAGDPTFVAPGSTLAGVRAAADKLRRFLAPAEYDELLDLVA